MNATVSAARRVMPREWNWSGHAAAWTVCSGGPSRQRRLPAPFAREFKRTTDSCVAFPKRERRCLGRGASTAGG
jgi:hypothetical protein